MGYVISGIVPFLGAVAVFNPSTPIIVTLLLSTMTAPWFFKNK